MPNRPRNSADTFADHGLVQWLSALAGTAVICVVIAYLTSLMNPAGYLVNLRLSLGFGLPIVVLLNLAHWVWPGRSERFNNGLGLVAGMLVGMFNLVWTVYGSPERLDWADHGLSIARDFLLALTFCSLAYYLFHSRYRMRWLTARVSEQQWRATETERELALSQLKLLQSQIEPHFLFNTLANVQGLVDTDPAAAKQLVAELTTMLRVSLGRTRQARTTLADELTVARSYLAIQSIRMGSRLSYSVDEPADLGDWPLPPLLVQPLVENAVIHGIEPSTAGGRVSVEVRAVDRALAISVRDTGQAKVTTTAGQGVGLSNVRERLERIYGAAATLSLSRPSGGGMLARLVVPPWPAEAEEDA